MGVKTHKQRMWVSWAMAVTAVEEKLDPRREQLIPYVLGLHFPVFEW